MSVKGTVVNSIQQYVKTKHKEDFNTWLDTLSPASREIFSNPINVSDLFDVKIGLIEPSEKVAALFFENRFDGAWQLGRYSAEVSLTGVYKAFVLIATPAFIMSRAGRIMKTLYTDTEFVVVDKSSNSVVTEARNLPEDHIVLEQRIGGWMEKALEITGCSNIDIKIPIRSSRKNEVTRYEITWD